MLACSMAHNAYAQTLGHKETVRQRNVIMVVQVTRTSKCAEGWDISTFFTLMHTKPQLMIGAVETQCRTNIIKNGMPTWATVRAQVSLKLGD